MVLENPKLYMAGLSKLQVEQFQNDGFLIIENFCDPKPLLNQAFHLLDIFNFENHPKSVFSTEVDKRCHDLYFLNSHDKIHYFLEENVLNIEGSLSVNKHNSINKIGHGLHLLDPIFSSFTRSKAFGKILEDLKFSNPVFLQSMLICKSAHVGGKVLPHQDSTFLYTSPLSTIGFWIALEDADENNGCLWFIPGSHKKYPISRRYVRNPNFFDAQTLKSITNPNEKSLIMRGCNLYGDELTDNYVKAEVKAGSLVIIHGSVVHQSLKNNSSRNRFAYTFHVIEGDADYSKENWLQRSN
jgi:phytanoyl-CoA hydroxylase